MTNLEQKSVNIKREFNSHGIGLEHQNGRCDVKWKRSILVVVFQPGGGGGYGWLDLGKNFFLKPLLMEFFFPAIQLHCMSGISLQNFFPLKSVFLHLKSQMVGPLAHRENGLSVPGL